MKSRIHLSLMAVLVSLVLLSACADAKKDEVKFKVISYNGSFTGSYSVDSGTNVSFSGAGFGNDGFIYEKDVEVDDQLEIDASPNSVDATGDVTLSSLEIKVYRDGGLITSVQDTSRPIEKITLTYTAGQAADGQ
ncbi:hypothetical protein KKI24_04950 [bacterium]|nr:hypothetical protein [bacterium]